jgi:hypothetical protein
MPYPILGTPKPAFFDSSGSPLVSGTLTIVDPSDDTNKATYPTYDDAVLLQNANANPYTLDSRGETTNEFWGLDGEDYKITLKDSTGANVWTVDDVRVPIILPYLQTAAEVAAGVTPTDVSYPPGDVRRYGTNTTPGTTDMSTAIQAALDVAANGGPQAFFPRDTYNIGTTAITPASNTRAYFDDATIIAGAGAAVEFDMISLSSVSNVQFHGKLRLKNTTTGTDNETYAIYGLSSSDLYMQAVYFEDVARGMELDQCTDCHFEYLQGNDIIGTLQGGAGDVSSVLVLNGCQRITASTIKGFDMQKPTLYLAVSTGGGANNNVDCSFGTVDVTHTTGSTTSNGLAVRSAVNCSVAQVNVRNGYRGVIIQQESGDTDYDIIGMQIGQINCRDIDNTTTANGVHIQSNESTKVIQNLQIGSIHVNGASDWGVYCDDVTDLSIGSILVENVSGGATEEGVRFEDIINGTIDSVQVKEVDGNGVRLIDCDRLTISTVRVEDCGQGTHNTFDAFRADADCSDCRVNQVGAYASDSGSAHARAADVLGTETSCSIGHVDDTDAATVPIVYNGVTLAWINNGRFGDTTVPGAGTWVAGDIVYNSAPSVDGSNMVLEHWLCTTGGSPGTWQTMRVSTVSPAT